MWSGCRRHQGFTLVEVMIAMTLGLVVMGSAFAVFTSQRATARLSSGVADIQNEGRIALDLLVRDVRAAGDFGCWPVSTPISVLATSAAFNPDDGALRGVDMAALSGLATSGVHGAAEVAAASPDSDAVALVGVSGALSELSGGQAASSDALMVKKPVQAFAANDVAVITDCINWTRFQITSATDRSGGLQELAHAAGAVAGTHGGGNLRGDLGETYGLGASVGRLDTTWWFVGQPDGKPRGLYRMSATSKVPVLVSPLVDKLRIRYDVDTDGDRVVNETAKTAATVSAWTGVRAVQVELLMRSKNQMGGQAGSYVFGGSTVTADDRAAYLSLRTTVGLRNL